MGRRCNREGCEKPATHTLHLRFWAKGYARDTSAPCTSSALVGVCDEHLQFAKDSEWYGPAQRTQIRGAIMAGGYAEPDFETAEIFLRPIKDGE